MCPPFLFHLNLFFPRLWCSRPHKKYPQVPQIVPRRPTHDGIIEPRKKRERIAPAKEIYRIDPRRSSPLYRFSVRHRPCCGAVSVNPIGSRAQHRDLLTRNSFRASEDKRGISSPDSASSYRGTYLSVRDERHSLTPVNRAQFLELREQQVRCLLHRQIICRIVAARHESTCFRRAMCRMEQIIHSQNQREVRSLERLVVALRCLRQCSFVEPVLQSRREFLPQRIFFDDALDVRRRCWIGNRGPGSQC